MKKTYSAILALLGATLSPAAVIYVDLSNVVVPYTDEGVYINILTGATEASFPDDFDDAPWLNLYYGGSRIFTSNLLRPLASTASYDDTEPGSYFVNLSPGATIDETGVFVGTGSVSTNHIGAGGDQFQSGQQGYLGFEYQATEGADVAYGWISVILNLTGEGYSVDLAYSDTPGEALVAGVIPEPSAAAALAGAVGLGAVFMSRRRRSV